MQIIDQIPEVFLNFILTLVFALIIGIEQKKRTLEETDRLAVFGTDRSFAFIGMLGFILYSLSPGYPALFIAGLVVVGIMLAVFYWGKIRDYKAYGMTSIMVALITYSLGPLIITQPKWLTVVIVVTVLILVERKEFLSNISKGINMDEFTTIAKFLIIAGVVLPISPKTPDIPYLNISAYTIWLTVVVVSTISYVSYLLQKFVFKKSGVVISGILGGMYSSTATTVILAKRSRELTSDTSNLFAASIITATAMMYLRIMLLMFIFNSSLGYLLLPYFLVLIAVSLITAGVVYYIKRPNAADTAKNADGHTNPLELKTALLFAGLFVFFSLLTHYVVSSFGFGGLNILSYIVGFTDIDPFLLNLFQGKYSIGMNLIAKASLQAIISNNILKAIYTYFFADKHTRKTAIIGLAVITVVNIILAVII
ncbi:MAG: DUF4010 domain-containing protein [Ignavibacteria bacterium]